MHKIMEALLCIVQIFFNGTLTLDLSASDYLEIYYTHESSNSSNGSATVGSPGEQCVFGGYRIGT